MPKSQRGEKIIKLENLKVAKILWPLIRPYFWMLCLSIFLVFMVTTISLLFPLLTQKVLDGFIIPVGPKIGTAFLGFKFESVFSFGAFFLAAVLLYFAFEFFQVLFMEYTGQKIIVNLRCVLFSHMTFLPVSYYDTNSSGRLGSRVTGDIENMNELFSSVLIFIFKDLVLMAGTLVILFNIDAKLTLYLSFLVPIIFISIVIFSKILRNIFRVIRQKTAEINHSFSEAITGITTIQTTASQDRFFQRFKTLNFEHFKAAVFQIKILATFMPFIRFLGLLSVAIILWTGSLGVSEHTLTIGELVAFLTYMRLFFQPLRDLSEKFNLLQNALASAERIVIILKTDAAKQRTRKKRNQLNNIKNIRFDQVDFSYDNKIPVLKNLSFFLPKGNSIGIVGKTGSGKSSIINLIAGFYTQNKGTIFIDDMDYGSLNMEDIRSRTALVMQDPVLFSGSIRHNIQPSGAKGDDAWLTKALYNANCEFLFEKFDGIDTQIKENGRPLSSGEKQLVCIARAFAFDSDLIIFDEATSYMDSQSEQKIHDAMKKLMKGRLSIIIAHRLSTVKECDTILVLRDGQIREKGSHKDLVKLKGEYYHLLEKEKI